MSKRKAPAKDETPAGKSNWRLFHGDNQPHPVEEFPPAPPWRTFDGVPPKEPRVVEPAPQRAPFFVDAPEIDLVNAAIYLRRPLLITGKPGIGKSSLVYAIAHELQLGKPLIWPINTRSTVDDGLYRYDAIGRLQEQPRQREEGVTANSSDEGDPFELLGKYVKLGPLGTAFLPAHKPRVLLIDEIDKSDIDLPNDLLNIFEDGSFEIPVLSRVTTRWCDVPVRAHDGTDRVVIHEGFVRVKEFPIVVMTSNGERDFPQPFLRRCIRMNMETPNEEKLRNIVLGHLQTHGPGELISEFHRRAQQADLATDQLLNAVFLTTRPNVEVTEALKESILKELK